jgi:hypothetical protein
MRVRADFVFVSGVLHTIALLSLVRAALWNYYSGTHKEILARLDVGFRAEAQTAHYLGVACLAIILIGLIVIWTGYVNRARSAWLVMFVIAWVWAFPLFVSPLFKGRVVLTFSEWLYSAMSQSGLPRTAAESILIFSLMVIALLLPIRSFFFTDETGRNASPRPSLELISGIATIVLLAGVALFTWIRVGVVYAIPADMLNAAQQLPPPPPPPQMPCKSQ